MRGWNLLAACGVFGAIGIASVGCSSFGVPSASEMWFGSPKSNEAAKAEAERIASLPTYSLEVYRDGYDPQKKDIPLEEVVFVQDAINRSGVTDSIGRMKVTLLRPQPGKFEPLRLPVKYNANKKIVANTEDYQIRPGDRLVLVEDPSTPVDDMLNSILPGGGTPGVWNGK